LDGGEVRLQKSGTGTTSLMGWGIGVSYSKPNSWFARLDYARRIGGDANLSDAAKAKDRTWFILGKIW
jgi:hemolysin activation/secretion protein